VAEDWLRKWLRGEADLRLLHLILALTMAGLVVFALVHALLYGVCRG
jgi:hypothetical protein